jgi:hypothetical protein
LPAQVDQIAELLRREISFLEQIPSVQIHEVLLDCLWWPGPLGGRARSGRSCRAAAVPAEPLPAMVTTSMP